MFESFIAFVCARARVPSQVRFKLNPYIFDRKSTSYYANTWGCTMLFCILVNGTSENNFWIVFDLGTKKQTFFINYKKAEAIIRTKKLAIFLIILVILNWIWNIYKEL